MATALKSTFRTLMALIMIGLVGVVIWRWEVNGWGSLLWLASMILITVIRAPYARKTKKNVIEDKRAENLECFLLVLVTIGGSFLPLIHLSTGVLKFANYSLPDWAMFSGLALLLPGFWLFWRSHADLGRNWSVTTELRQDQQLVTTGVYKRIRHPMYAAIFLLFLPQPLFVHNWIAGFAGPLAFLLMYFIRVPYEEAMMRSRFGAAYDAYCEKSGRIWPG